MANRLGSTVTDATGAFGCAQDTLNALLADLDSDEPPVTVTATVYVDPFCGVNWSLVTDREVAPTGTALLRRTFPEESEIVTTCRVTPVESDADHATDTGILSTVADGDEMVTAGGS
jgi:hypothetical protein